MRDRPVISTKNYTIDCGDADENKVGGCAIAVRKDYNNLMEEFGSTSQRRGYQEIRTPAGCSIPFEVITGVRQGAVAGPFLFNFAIDDIMRTVDQCLANIVLAPSACPLTDLDYADDVIFTESSTKLQHVVNTMSKLAAAYGQRLRNDECMQMWISSRP
ncbi:hypothetical protein RB195_001851 [Necator americanus]|uniref:Reverse transcriptase domain-containing protein n=1 Tax=Necator americanus TaxID=51031 RepID=A0ABR1DHR6_NECAM